MLTGHYDRALVLISVLVAVFASYTALSLAERVSRSERPAALRWIAGGAFAMGTGIWAMHFIGMLAFRLPIPMGYDLGITLLSWALPIGVSVLALAQLSGPQPSGRALAASAVILGLGINAMHYLGMAAMQMEPAIDYDPAWVAASVVIAIAAAGGAMWIGFRLRGRSASRAWHYRALAAVVMGLAIVGMHYTGMQAANFPAGSVCRAATGNFSLTQLAALVIVGALGVLSITLLATIHDARMDARSAVLAATEEVSRERQRLLDQERALRAEAERLSAVKDQFLATLSHELRTPLNTIVGWVQVLQIKNDAASVKTGLETIERNAWLQARLIDDLLDMSRIISGQVRLERDRVDLGALAQAAVDAARPAAAAKSIALHCDAAPLGGHVEGDAVRLQQVLSNLLSNAIKFTAAHGRVDVRVRAVGERAEVSVDDNGIGIAPEFLGQVFERFRQADSSTTRRHGGLGLGLAIVRELVQMQGGTVQAASAGEGRGARFVVALPLVREAAPTPAASPVLGAPEPPPAALRGATVLVVDDDRDAGEVMARMLGASGAVVHVATSADEGLELVGRLRPRLVLSDIGMPVKDGFALVRELRAGADSDAAATPAIAVSAFTRPEDAGRALREGFDAHVAKPVDFEALWKVVSEVMGRAPRRAARAETTGRSTA